MKTYFFSLLSVIIISTALNAQVKDIALHTENDNVQVTFAIQLPDKKYLYKDFLQLTSDHPEVAITSWNVAREPEEQYDNAFKEIKKVYRGEVPFQVFLAINPQEVITDAALHVRYHSNGTQDQIKDLVVPLDFSVNPAQDLSDQHASPKNLPVACKVVTPKNTAPQENAVKESAKELISSNKWSTYMSQLITEQKSIGLRLLLIFFLGFLLSLTPCIYPMIPVTIGVLQASIGTSRSLWKNFLVALSYTLGLSTTFALFGLLASCVGPLCGQLLSNPYFVIILVLLLLYFAISMLGFYEIRLPMVNSTHRRTNNSFISAFIFGAASGTFASPCVSPGLALLLSLAVTVGSKLMGFLFLFVFGIGLSVPLLIIGTVSSFVNFLPRAGVWMIEVKRIFGVLMIGACLFYLSFITPLPLLYALITLSCIILAFVYSITGGKMHHSVWRPLSYVIAVLLVAGACVSSFYLAKELFIKPQLSVDPVSWRKEYTSAVAEAVQTKKYLFVDLWAPYCSICIAINKKVLLHPDVVKALEEYIPLKIDMANQNDKQVQRIREQFDVVGVPVFMVIDPSTQKIIKKWGADLYGMAIGDVVQELNKARGF